MLRIALIAAAAFALAACSDDDEGFAEDPYAGRSAASIYQEGEALLNEGEPISAGETFEELERVHPYSEWSTAERRGDAD